MGKRPSILDSLDIPAEASPVTVPPDPASAEIVQLVPQPEPQATPPAEPQPAPQAEPQAAAPRPAAKRARPSRDVQHTSIYIPLPAYNRLREIAFVEHPTKIHDLIMEGIDRVIKSRGHAERASRKKGR